MEHGYVKADSTNLPKIDSFMITEFIVRNCDYFSSECRNVKTALSARESYGDDAVGYVQLKRENRVCTIKCQMCPEHKVRSNSYACTLIINEQKEEVESVVCHDCPASTGGCKHAIAFLWWCFRRSEEPACTAIECYWKKSKLAKIGTSIKFILAKDMSKKSLPDNTLYSTAETLSISNTSVIEHFKEECKKRKICTCQWLKHEPDYVPKQINMLSLHYLMCKHNKEFNCDKFLSTISSIVNEIFIKNAEKESRHQHKSGLWYELRYGRITASKCYEVSRCKTADGTLIASILGARTPLTSAMRRGQVLENKVKQVVETKLGHKIGNCGLFISEEFPMVAGSPDGIYKKSTLVEIKCPTSVKTFKTYIKDGVVTKKYLAQVQMQMFCAKADNSYFCVASPDFETDNFVNIVKVEYNESFVRELLQKVVSFWKENVYPILYESTKI